MSTDPAGSMSGSQGEAGDAAAQPSEEELRAAYEAELSRITSTDMMAQAVVSLLNIGARRLGLLAQQEGAGGTEPVGQSDARAGGDLEQVRDAIDGAKALLEILERRIPNELRSLRDALSQLQMAYAREVQAGSGAPSPAPEGSAGESGAASPPSPATGGGEEGGPGPAESSGRLWVPGR
jgi:hypothetical protein